MGADCSKPRQNVPTSAQSCIFCIALTQEIGPSQLKTIFIFLYVFRLFSCRRQNIRYRLMKFRGVLDVGPEFGG